MCILVPPHRIASYALLICFCLSLLFAIFLIACIVAWASFWNMDGQIIEATTSRKQRKHKPRHLNAISTWKGTVDLGEQQH